MAKDGRQASSFSLSLTLITVKICWVLNNFFFSRGEQSCENKMMKPVGTISTTILKKKKEKRV